MRPDSAIDDPAYQEALRWVYACSSNGRSTADVVAGRPQKLPRIRALLAALGNPERAFASVLVAGTKGKGSTAALIESIARAAGHRTGLYTSPHLQDYCERIQINGEPISHAQLAELVEEIKPAVAEIAKLTTFEITTALGFMAFAKADVGAAVIEVGLGGRLDATNVVTPRV